MGSIMDFIGRRFTLAFSWIVAATMVALIPLPAP